ncbi:MAG: YegP family protein [Acidobacteriota bacterium]|nr:YegP family protein [Acidobacteriota bacterium]
MKFQIVQNTSRQFYWRLVASNSLIIAVGVESYGNRVDCRRAIDLVVRAPASQFHVYQDFQQLWRWRLSSPGGQVVAIAGETYVTRQEAAESAALAAGADADTPLEELHDSGTAIRARWPPGTSGSK